MSTSSCPTGNHARSSNFPNIPVTPCVALCGPKGRVKRNMKVGFQLKFLPQPALPSSLDLICSPTFPKVKAARPLFTFISFVDMWTTVWTTPTHKWLKVVVDKEYPRYLLDLLHSNPESGVQRVSSSPPKLDKQTFRHTALSAAAPTFSPLKNPH